MLSLHIGRKSAIWHGGRCWRMSNSIVFCGFLRVIIRFFWYLMIAMRQWQRAERIYITPLIIDGIMGKNPSGFLLFNIQICQIYVIQKRLYGSYLAGGNSNTCYFHPDPWGNSLQFDEHIFSDGFGKNHQLTILRPHPKVWPHPQSFISLSGLPVERLRVWKLRGCGSLVPHKRTMFVLGTGVNHEISAPGRFITLFLFHFLGGPQKPHWKYTDATRCNEMQDRSPFCCICRQYDDKIFVVNLRISNHGRQSMIFVSILS